MSARLLFQWDGEAMRPTRRNVSQANSEFVVGAHYLMEPIDEVQSARDRAFHAELRDLWTNLPERFDGQFPDYDGFRGHALVECRYALITPIPAGSAKAAREIAAAIALVKRKGYSIVTVTGTVVHVIQAMSQAIRGGDMTKEQRFESYKDVLDYAHGLLGAAKGETERQSGEAA